MKKETKPEQTKTSSKARDWVTWAATTPKKVKKASIGNTAKVGTPDMG